VADSEERAGPSEDEQAPEVAEQRFAANLRETREAQSMSQYALAREMSDRGWPWRQQTVARIETGQRMVRLGEGTAIAEILHIPLDTLIQPIGETRDAELLSEWIKRARTAYKEIVRAAAELITTRGNLRGHPALVGLISPRLEELAQEARAVQALTPDAAIAEAAGQRARDAALIIARAGAGGTVTIRPASYPDAAKIADALREGEIVVLDLTGMGDAEARRFMDYASGALRVRSGSVTELGDGRYQLVPATPAVSGEPGSEDGAHGFRLEDQPAPGPRRDET
jgi:cell division inhibitor SepF